MNESDIVQYTSIVQVPTFKRYYMKYNNMRYRSIIYRHDALISIMRYCRSVDILCSENDKHCLAQNDSKTKQNILFNSENNTDWSTRK